MLANFLARRLSGPPWSGTPRKKPDLILLHFFLTMPPTASKHLEGLYMGSHRNSGGGLFALNAWKRQPLEQRPDMV